MNDGCEGLRGKTINIKSNEERRIEIEGERVLTYGPGKGACILRLTLQSVPLETIKKTESRTKPA